MEDGEILELLYGHSEQGLELVGEKYGRLLLSISGGILPPDDAEECVNDTYLKVWRVIPPYRPTHLRSFLCKITRQISIDRYRKLHLKKSDASLTVSLDELDKELADERLKTDDAEELTEAINRFLKNTDAESRTLFLRRYFLLESQAELARRFEMTENNVNVKLCRIRAKLKKYLSERGLYHDGRNS